MCGEDFTQLSPVVGSYHMVVASIFLIVPLCLTYAALTDLLNMTIPNRISLILVTSFVAITPFTGMSVEVFATSFAAGAMVFIVCFSLFAANVMGGGDAKLLTSVAVWFGLNQSLAEFLLAVTFTGGVLTVAILILRSRAQEILAVGFSIPDSLLMARKVPYGIAIAVAGLATYGESPIVSAAIASLY